MFKRSFLYGLLLAALSVIPLSAQQEVSSNFSNEISENDVAWYGGWRGGWGWRGGYGYGYNRPYYYRGYYPYYYNYPYYYGYYRW